MEHPSAQTSLAGLAGWPTATSGVRNHISLLSFIHGKPDCRKAAGAQLVDDPIAAVEDVAQVGGMQATRGISLEVLSVEVDGGKTEPGFL
jgi:hypothetical protein